MTVYGGFSACLWRGFKDLCLDAVDVEQAARFWAPTLGLEIRRSHGNVWLAGTSPTQTIWVNQVPEPKSVKNRVHLDVHTPRWTS